MRPLLLAAITTGIEALHVGAVRVVDSEGNPVP